MLSSLIKKLNLLSSSLSALDYVLGVAIGGSLARGTATAYSDLDLFILLSSSKKSLIDEALLGIVQKYLDVAFHIDRGFVADMGYIHQFIASDGSLLDITLITIENHEYFNIQPTMKVVFEKDNNFSSIIKSAKHFSDISEEERSLLVREHVGLFYVFMITLVKSFRKNDVWLSIYNIERIRKGIIYLTNPQGGSRKVDQ